MAVFLLFPTGSTEIAQLKVEGVGWLFALLLPTVNQGISCFSVEDQPKLLLKRQGHALDNSRISLQARSLV